MTKHEKTISLAREAGFLVTRDEIVLSEKLKQFHDLAIAEEQKRLEPIILKMLDEAAAKGAALEREKAGERGDVVVTWDEQRTKIVAVTRQDKEGRILGVIAEAPAEHEQEKAEQQEEPVAWRAWSDAHGYTVWETLKEAEHYSDEDHDPEPLYLRNSSKKAEAHDNLDAALRQQKENNQICPVNSKELSETL